jgi:hypothetical protein
MFRHRFLFGKTNDSGSDKTQRPIRKDPKAVKNLYKFLDHDDDVREEIVELSKPPSMRKVASQPTLKQKNSTVSIRPKVPSSLRKYSLASSNQRPPTSIPPQPSPTVISSRSSYKGTLNSTVPKRRLSKDSFSTYQSSNQDTLPSSIPSISENERQNTSQTTLTLGDMQSQGNSTLAASAARAAATNNTGRTIEPVGPVEQKGLLGRLSNLSIRHKKGIVLCQ